MLVQNSVAAQILELMHKMRSDEKTAKVVLDGTYIKS